MTNNRNNLFWAYEMWGIETGELATAIYDNAKDMDFCDYADTEDIDRASLKAALDQILATAQDGNRNYQALLTALVMGHNLI